MKNFQASQIVFVFCRFVFCLISAVERFMICLDTHWNDRRWRRVFLCFYSAIFQLTRAKFQTLGYNSSTVWSRYINFDSSLRFMSCMFVSNFEAIGHVTLVLEPKNRPESWA